MCVIVDLLLFIVLKKFDFYYDLLVELIVQVFLIECFVSCLLLVLFVLVVFIDLQVCDLLLLLQLGDLLVFNDIWVIFVCLFGQKVSGGCVEILIECLFGGQQVCVQVGVSKLLKVGSCIVLDVGGEVEVLGCDGEFYVLQFYVLELLEQWLFYVGCLLLLLYIQCELGVDDCECYQIVFVCEVGVVVVLIVGLYFDELLLVVLKEKGVEFGYVILYVGVGIFQLVCVEDLKDYVMYCEWLNVGVELVQQVWCMCVVGGWVIGVGIIVVCVLESVMCDGELLLFVGEMQIFIILGYCICSVDVMVINFYLLESMLLMMIFVFVGKEWVFEVYWYVIEQCYCFFSYGDVMLLFLQVG